MAIKKGGSSSTKTQDIEEKPKFSNFLTSYVVKVTIAKSKTYYLHAQLLIAESERFLKDLSGPFKEATDRAIDVEDEDPELFGFFVEYLYRDRSILSRTVEHYSEYVTLARLYAMGERLSAPAFQGYCLYRFTDSLGSQTLVSEESICELLHVACTEITERVREDPMRSYIFWYGGNKIAKIQKFGMFRQMLHTLPDLGRHLCLWVNGSQPPKCAMPSKLHCQIFGPESEYNHVGSAEITENELEITENELEKFFKRVDKE